MILSSDYYYNDDNNFQLAPDSNPQGMVLLFWTILSSDIKNNFIDKLKGDSTSGVVADGKETPGWQTLQSSEENATDNSIPTTTSNNAM